MSSFGQFLKRVCKQDALYWGTPVNNGYEDEYTPPILIKCRWEDVSEFILDDKGCQILCKAKVIVMADLSLGGVLYLGDFSGITNEHRVDPLSLDNAYIIQRISKIPRFGSTTEFVRTVWLG